MSAGPTVKVCGCGRAYDPAAWAALPLVGHQHFASEAVALEMRNCSCKSTICVEVPAVRTSGLKAVAP